MRQAYQQSLEGTVDNTKAENNQLRKELEAAKETISKLQNEIALLKVSNISIMKQQKTELSAQENKG